MTYSPLLADYLGSGLASARPTALSLFPGAVGFYYATDSEVLSVWTGTAWVSFSLGGVPSFAGGLTATGTTQATAFQLTTVNAQFTTITAGAGVILATLVVGASSLIINDGVNLLLVYPVSGQNFTGLATNAPVEIPPGGSATFWQVSNSGVSVR